MGGEVVREGERTAGNATGVKEDVVRIITRASSIEHHRNIALPAAR
jgi:hypothetical protein